MGKITSILRPYKDKTQMEGFNKKIIKLLSFGYDDDDDDDDDTNFVNSPKLPQLYC